MRATLALALALLSTPAVAQTLQTTTTCVRFGPVLQCSTATGVAQESGSVRTVRATPAEAEAAAEARADRLARWERLCRPALGAPDANGVQRYVYAQPGCEYGRAD